MTNSKKLLKIILIILCVSLIWLVLKAVLLQILVLDEKNTLILSKNELTIFCNNSIDKKLDLVICREIKQGLEFDKISYEDLGYKDTESYSIFEREWLKTTYVNAKSIRKEVVIFNLTHELTQFSGQACLVTKDSYWIASCDENWAKEGSLVE